MSQVTFSSHVSGDAGVLSNISCKGVLDRGDGLDRGTEAAGFEKQSAYEQREQSHLALANLLD